MLHKIINRNVDIPHIHILQTAPIVTLGVVAANFAYHQELILSSRLYNHLPDNCRNWQFWYFLITIVATYY